jgi:hypothetical protein
MNRLRTLFALAGIALMTAVVGSAGITGARAEDQQDPNRSRLNDPANARNASDHQDPKTSRLNDDAAARRDPAADAHSADDKANKRDVK